MPRSTTALELASFTSNSNIFDSLSYELQIKGRFVVPDEFK